MSEIFIDLLTAHEKQLVGLAVAAVTICVILSLRRWRAHLDDPATVREFKNVFFNITDRDRERIIANWMEKKRCGRNEAMRAAVEDWRWSQRSWR